jgi:hypothetical protein
MSTSDPPIAITYNGRKTDSKPKAISRKKNPNRHIASRRRRFQSTIKTFIRQVFCAKNLACAIAFYTWVGDSSVGNAAFDLADIALRVIHKETSDNLACDCFVKFEDIATFLKSFLKNSFRSAKN